MSMPSILLGFLEVLSHQCQFFSTANLLLKERSQENNLEKLAVTVQKVHLKLQQLVATTILMQSKR